MKNTLLFTLLLVSCWADAQTTLNNYKYVLVPTKFDFLKEADQYTMNTLTKTLLERKGFTVYFDDQSVPPAIVADRCQALKAEVALRKGLLATNLTLLLKDCQGNIVYKSKEGKSREKEWAAGYQGALMDAFSSFDTTQYVYNGNTPTRSVPSTPPPAETAPVAIPAAASATPAETTAAGTLYAQATVNGYQLIDTKPQIVFTLFKTSNPETFLAEKGSYRGIVFKKDGGWTFEYYQDGKLMGEKLAIKF